MVRRSLALAVALLVPLALPADEKVTIKVSKDEMKGDRQHVTRTETAVNTSTIKGTDGAVLQDQKRVDEKQLTYDETILEKVAGKRPSHLSRRYEAVTVKVNGKAEDTGLAGKTVVVERKDGKHQFKLDDGTLSPAATRLLAADFKDGSDEESMFEKNMLPKVPVAVGETWKCDMPDLVKDFTKATGSKIDADRATGSGKLLKVYDKDGKKFGTLEVIVELPVTELKGGAGPALKMDAGSRFKVTIHYDGCIDGSRTEGTIKFGMDLNGTAKIDRPDGTTLSAAIGSTNSRTETVKELGKK
jgi:hypothetical protein